jgi:hypothetical protein
VRLRELELRKELAVTHLRIARGELALAEAQKPESMTTASSALDLASSLLEHHPLGKWGRYLRLMMIVARVVIGVRSGLGHPRLPHADTTH